MLHYKDSVFAPPIRYSIRRLAIFALSLAIACFASWRFYSLLDFNLGYLAMLIFGIIFYAITPIYKERKEKRTDSYIRHLDTLPMDILQQYRTNAESDFERDLIDGAIAAKMY